ncbi:hypothetical protein E4T91_05470 [Ligilactobacillus murinus]|uniref:hypothetical protein n=1 Tax=Ligilactobacillus murinus TaxID=1622 RepID=UPI001071A81F|nr:hypothetical protein [Ligilactobacillus murinus]MBF0758193.1 hypothetical protein [Ligilactobacillus murinus]MBF0831970.1 hypothetical protein [Ligilactobacillus murinus]TFU64382.1 hypothetical protein E4T91_05470 [Ligilactobacillus murinus]
MIFDLTFKVTTDTIIALLALLVALASFIYTWSFNRFKISISDIDITKFDGENFFAFSINNHSPRAVNITHVELISASGKIIFDNGFEPFSHMTNPYYISDPFESNIVIFPNNSNIFSYYLNEYPKCIKIYSDERIHNHKKHQLFVISINDPDQRPNIE